MPPLWKEARGLYSEYKREKIKGGIVKGVGWWEHKEIVFRKRERKGIVKGMERGGHKEIVFGNRERWWERVRKKERKGEKPSQRAKESVPEASNL